MRDILFLSHAAQEDNDFTRWLSLQLVGLGYKVWSDVVKLKGGEDWWPVIEKEIRENTVKFLVVLSNTSNNKEGVRKELMIAQQVQKKIGDDNFIAPIHIDAGLDPSDFNIEVVRLNSIDFTNSWAEGLHALLDFLTEHNVPKSEPNYGEVNRHWQTIHLANQKPIVEEEIYESSWFSIVEFPTELRFHQFGTLKLKRYKELDLHYPVTRYKQYLATFAWCYDFIDQLPDTETYDSSNTIRIPTQEILDGTYDTEFISNREASRLIIQLCNNGFHKALPGKLLIVKEMSRSISYWIEEGVIENNKVNKIQLIGKQKDKKWHFGISGHVRLFPEPMFVVKSHIWFTEDGKKLIESSSIQHSLRRRQGKNWWNNQWRTKLMAFVQFIAESDQTVHIPLGGEELLRFDSQPIPFVSPVTYSDPSANNLPEDIGENENYGEDEADPDNEIQPV